MKNKKKTDVEALDLGQGVELAPTNLTATQKAALCDAVQDRYGTSIRQLRVRKSTFESSVRVNSPGGTRYHVQFFPSDLGLLNAMERVPNFVIKVPHPSGEANKMVDISWATIPDKVKKAIASHRKVSAALGKSEADRSVSLEGKFANKLLAVQNARKAISSKMAQEELALEEAYEKAIAKLRTDTNKKIEALEAKWAPKKVKAQAHCDSIGVELSRQRDILSTELSQKRKDLNDELARVITDAANAHSEPYTQQAKLLQEQIEGLEAAQAETILRIKLNGAAETGMAFLAGLPSPAEVAQNVTKQLKALPGK